jgi:ADP-ribose pyrophosphatase YjhB (NUDIX family)
LSFAESHLGEIRQLVGSRLLLVPGARIVIQDANGRVLLQKRSDFGVWGLPGGNAEPGEDLMSVIYREVFEETGLVITDAKPFGFSSNPDTETVMFPNGDQCQFFVLNFFTQCFSGDLVIRDGESLELDWFDMNQLPEMLPNMSASLRAYGVYCSNAEFELF